MSLISWAELAVAALPPAGYVQLAWLGWDQQIHSALLDTQGRLIAPSQLPAAAGLANRSPANVPKTILLGSLWKLVAYARLTETPSPSGTMTVEQPYVCKGQAAEEVYCCQVGQSIDRATALWRSCGLYFQPQRIDWAGLTLGPTLQALPASLHHLQTAQALNSQTRVPLADWLNWLNDWAPSTRQAAQQDLLAYWLAGPGQAALGRVGSRLQLKTFTLESRAQPGQRWAGASGWLSDGRPIWFAARGSSKDVLPQWAPLVLQHIDQVEPPADLSLLDTRLGACIEVQYFARYPIQAMRNAHGVLAAPSQPGTAPKQAQEPLRVPLEAGRYTVVFQSGVSLPITSQRDLSIIWTANQAPRLVGRLSLNDYVARVIDREGSAQPAAAARALAIAARTYVLSHGIAQGACLAIDDSSARQRVAPRPPSRAAMWAAMSTADLVLKGADGRYHVKQASPGVMSWQNSVQQAQQGQDFVAILAAAYPNTALASLAEHSATDCEALPQVQAWLAHQTRAWHRRLQAEAGYSLPNHVQICRLQSGLPHTQRQQQRLYVRGIQSPEDRLTLAHEYLHLAFAGHPRGSDERFIENLARKLMGLYGS